jgi:hypothetical protein
MVKWLNFLLQLICIVNLWGQDSSKVTFVFPNEGKFEIRIDENRVESANTFMLKTGQHTIEIWNGCMELVYDTIFVSQGVPRVYQYRSKPSEEYKIYKKKKSRYNSNLFGMCVIPEALFLSSSVLSTMLFIKCKRLNDQLLDLNSQYYASTSPQFLSSYQNEFNIIERDLKAKRRNALIFSGLGLTSGVFSFFGIKNLIKKFEKPRPNCYRSPFTGNDYSLNFELSLSSCSLKLNF